MSHLQKSVKIIREFPKYVASLKIYRAKN